MPRHDFGSSWGANSGKGTGGASLPQHPLDGKEYVWSNGKWILIQDLIDAGIPMESDKHFVRRRGGWVSVDDLDLVGHSPDDGRQYLLKGNLWVALEAADIQDVRDGVSTSKYVTPKSLDGLLDRIGIDYDQDNEIYYVDEGRIDLT